MAFYSRNGARFSLGVVPRELRSGRPGAALPGVCGSTEVRRGVCIPDGVDVPLVFLVGAGDAAPDAVLDETPFVWVVVVVVPLVLVLVDPTDSRDGLGVVVLLGGIRRVGMRDGVASSVLSSDRVDPCRDGGFDPARDAGRELGRELALDPPGVI